MEIVDDLRRALEASQAETAALKAAAEGMFFWGGRNRQVPKFPKREDEAAMWRLRFRTHLDGMGLGYTLDQAVTPVPVKGNQGDLILRYGEVPVQQAQAAWACLLDATAGGVFEVRVLSAMTVRDAWCQVLNWINPSSEAEKLFLERQLELVRNYGDEDPNFFFSRVDQLLVRLRSIDVHKTEQQIVNILVRNLSDHYEIEKRSRLDSPFLRRRDVERIVRASWATRKMRQLEQQSELGMTPNPHALVAGGGFHTTRGGYGGPRRGCGRSSGGRRGVQRSWSRGGGNHHFHRQQQQQQPRPPPKPLMANFGLGGPFDGGINAGGWPQEESPPSPNGLSPHFERCGRKGHVARICRTPPRFEGICGTCGQYGHQMRYCIRNQYAPHALVVAPPVASPATFSPAPPAGGSGNNITTGASGFGGGGGGAYGHGYGDGRYGGGAYSSGPQNQGGHDGASCEVAPVGQSPGGGGAGHDIPSWPPGAPDGDTNATYAYRRTPFVAQRVTFGNGAIRAPAPPPAATSMGGSGTGGLVGQSRESDAVTAPSLPPVAFSAGRGDVDILQVHPGGGGGIRGDITLLSLQPVAPSPEEGNTGVLRSQPEAAPSTPAPPPPASASPAADSLSDTAFEEWLESDRLDIPMQRNNPRSQPRRHIVTPAVTRSAARAQLGVGDQLGAFAASIAKESIGAAIGPGGVRSASIFRDDYSLIF